MIGSAYAKSKDASYKPTTYESPEKLPTHLRDDVIVRQVVEEADPRRQLPINWSNQEQQELYDRLVVDEKDLVKYIKLYKQLLNKAQHYHEKVIYIETLAHMKVTMVLPILEPFVSGRLSLAQCLGNQPLDTKSTVDYSGQTSYKAYEQSEQSGKDWSEQSATGAEECNYMRTIAIYALAHLSRSCPDKVQAILLPVFENTYEPYQLRIAAYTTMILTPVPEHVLERIASQMWREPSKEVASFVVGSIDTMSKMTSPAMGPWRDAAQRAADSMPKQYLDTFKYSWFAGGDHFNKQKQTGSVWVSEIIKSNVSVIPRAAYVHFGRYHGQTGNKFDSHLELGFTSKGIESILKKYIAYNKQQELTGSAETNIVASIFENLYDSKDDIAKYYREARDVIKQSILDGEQKPASESFVQDYFFKRQQPIDGVNSHLGKQNGESLFEAIRPKRSITINARSSSDDDEEAKLTVFSKLFDSTSYYAMDKKQIIELLEQSDDYIKMIADELIMGGKLHYVKMLSPSNMWHMVPSQMGLPMIATHRSPMVISLKVDGSHNGQLTSTKVSQYLRQQATGSRVPNVQGQNYASKQGSLNITALVHPKIMHSNFRFLFAVEQANCDAYGVHTEKSHQLSIPMEVSVAYSPVNQRFSFQVEPKTPARMIWTKEAGKTFIGQVTLATPSTDNWLGREQLIRVPSQQSQYKRAERAEMFVPSILAGIQSFINEPKQSQKAAIQELETPYKFEHRFIQQLLGLEFYLEGVSDDEDVARVMSKPELSTQTGGQLQWTKTDEVDELEQHSKSGPMSQLLHVYESAVSRPSKYLEFYTTLKPSQSHNTPVYRFDFVLDGNQEQKKQQYGTIGRRPTGVRYPIGVQPSYAQAKLSNEIKQQQMILEAY